MAGGTSSESTPELKLKTTYTCQILNISQINESLKRSLNRIGFSKKTLNISWKILYTKILSVCTAQSNFLVLRKKCLFVYLTVCLRKVHRSPLIRSSCTYQEILLIQLPPPTPQKMLNIWSTFFTKQYLFLSVIIFFPWSSFIPTVIFLFPNPSFFSHGYIFVPTTKENDFPIPEDHQMYMVGR